MFRALRERWKRQIAPVGDDGASAFLEKVLNTLVTPVFVKDRSHHFIMVNDAFCVLVGRTRLELMDKSDYDLFPRAEADEFVRRDELVFTTLQQNSNEEVLTTAHGSRRTIVTRRAAFRDFTGRDVLVGVISDITEQKHNEELLRLNAQVFEHSTEGMFISDEHNRILAVNRAFTDITGYPSEEAIGRNPRFLSSGTLSAEFYQEMWRHLSNEGYWTGEMVNRRKTGELFSEWLTISTVRRDDGRLRYYIALFSDVTQRKRAEERILFLAHHDPLTGLPNRALLGDRVQQAVARSTRSQTSAALLMADLDRFKEINDSLGHQAGDQLLREVAQRLIASVRASDTVARFGGDEFVILLAETTGPDDAKIAAKKILEALARPFLLSGREAWLGVSIGISVFPRDGSDADSLLRAADEAMYRVKRAGRNHFAFATDAG